MDNASGRAEYMRRWRAGNAARQGYDRAQSAAYNRALTRLRERHRGEFDALYAQEKEKGGLA